jgi:hypothetical protein
MVIILFNEPIVPFYNSPYSPLRSIMTDQGSNVNPYTCPITSIFRLLMWNDKAAILEHDELYHN